MTSTTNAPQAVRGAGPNGLGEWLRIQLGRPLVASVVLLAVYVGLSSLNDPAGYLGTDTGGKVATLEVMSEQGTVDPDLGYWAERWDPDGNLHPLFYTSQFGDRWVNVTTLPAVLVAAPLYGVGGYRMALLVPMAGAIAAALAAAALARRLRPDDPSGPMTTFWLIGLASPLAVYALDFWEHTLGVALLGWAAVALVDVRTRRGGWRTALLAGVLVGIAGTMRTEALAYGAVATAVTCGLLVWPDRRVATAVRTGAMALIGLILPLVANDLLERAIVGQSMRSGRATGTVGNAVSGSTGGQAVPSRVVEALVTGLGIHPSLDWLAIIGGVAGVGLLTWTVVRGQTDARAAIIGLVATGLLYLTRFTDGLGFVPGLVPATPLAVAGLVLGSRRGPVARQLIITAMVALPVVWATQFRGGAVPQWAGRYILVSGFLLAVVGVSTLSAMPRRLAGGLVVLSVAVTAFGVAWLSVRSAEVAESGAALAARDEPVLVSDVAHLFRETGAWYGDTRQLTAVGPGSLDRAADVVERAGFDEFALVQAADDDAPAPPPQIGEFSVVSSDQGSFLRGVGLRITTYRR